MLQSSAAVHRGCSGGALVAVESGQCRGCPCGGWIYRVMIHFPKLPNCGFGKAGVKDDQPKSHGSCTIGTTGTRICETNMERCAEVVGNGHHQREAAGPRNNRVGLEVRIW